MMTESEKTICMICRREFKNLLSLATHIRRSHHISVKEYYDRFLKKPGEGICPITGKPTKFSDLRRGYAKYAGKGTSTKDVAIKEKYKQTCLKRYGVENVFQSEEIKEQIRQTWLEKYGADHPMQKRDILEKQKRTCLEKYGVENVSQLETVKEKKKQTCLEKYGVKSTNQLKEVREKYKQTCLKRYGVENASQSDEVKKRIKQTWLEKYGVENPLQNQEIRQKIRTTMKKKYGVEHPMYSFEIKEKRKQTCLERYGVEHPVHAFEVREKLRKKQQEKFLQKLVMYLDHLNLELLDPVYKHAHYIHTWRCKKCGHEFTQIWNAIQQGYLCPKCYPKPTGSKQENELVEFVKRLEINIVRHDRNLIKPLELDIVIPDYKIAIEHDGLYWHNENFVGETYHLEKTEACESKGYRLIHIFEDEWILKKDIVKSRLKHILGKTEDCTHIGARECIIKEISSQEKNNFLEQFHIQGPDASTVKLGAFYQNQLVAVMTFSHGSLAKGVKQQDPLVWELNRFCTHSDFVISGIASKLLGYFKRNYKWEQIFSYADRRWSSGDLYKKLGFQLEHITQPNYWYSKGFGRIHRFNLKKRPDEPKDIPEYILRLKEGYTRIWDCGNLKFVLENNINEKGDQSICLQAST